MRRKLTFLKRRIAISLLLITFFCVQAVFVLNDSITVFERNTYYIVIRLMSPALTFVMTAISAFGSTTAVAVIIIAVILLPRVRRSLGFPLVAVTSASVLLNHLLKNAIARPRPDIMRLVDETGYGFPSGHAMNNAALYTMLALVACRQVKRAETRLLIVMLSAAMPFFIGISRIYLGVHGAADILAGWALGAACALIADTLLPACSQGKLN